MSFFVCPITCVGELQKLISKKTIKPGSCRYLGKLMPDIVPSEIPVGGRCLNVLSAGFNGVGYQVGRTSLKNAIVLEKLGLRFLYVRPQYAGYRRVGIATFCGSNSNKDFDHVVAKSLALNLGLQYVLLTRISKRSNRSHGALERRIELNNHNLDIYYADRRIWDKWLGRHPHLLKRPLNELTEFKASKPGNYELTLKQRGKWAQAIGFDENYELPLALRPINLRVQAPRY